VNAIVLAALYHDCGEVITGDLPSPIKYHTPEITQAYKAIERQAEQELLNLLPNELQTDYRDVLIEDRIAEEHRTIIKAADTIAAFIKCRTEVNAGNQEFSKAEEAVKARLESLEMPEVRYFMDTFIDSYGLTLDELLSRKK